MARKFIGPRNIGCDESGQWWDHRGWKVKSSPAWNEVAPVELEIDECIPEPVSAYHTGNENLYFEGLSGLTYYCKCL